MINCGTNGDLYFSKHNNMFDVIPVFKVSHFWEPTVRLSDSIVEHGFYKLKSSVNGLGTGIRVFIVLNNAHFYLDVTGLGTLVPP